MSKQEFLKKLKYELRKLKKEERNNPTHQIVFCTEKALKTLEFEGSYLL